MPKITKITKSKSSWQLGWIDGLERQEGRSLGDGVEAAPYWRGIDRAREFIKRISAANSRPKREAVIEPF